MLLLLLVCLMKLVDMSTMYRPRPKCGGSTKENRMQNCHQQYLQQQQQQQSQHQQQEQQQQLTSYDYQKLNILRQKQKLLILQRHLQRQQFEEWKRLQLKQQQLKQQQQQQQHRKQQQNHPQLKQNKNGFRIGEKGIKPQRGMTEHLTNENKKPCLPQLNHNSPHHHHSHIINQKRPLTSPTTAYNNTYGFTTTTNYNNCQSSYYNNYNINKNSFNRIFDDELTEENLKKNVQIVLNNLDRYSNALKSIILNEQSSISYYSNNNSNNNNAGGMMANVISSPESDYNSNPPHHPFGGLNCSIASSHDFTHDNSDYQWFLDYGYRDGGFAHQSVLSSLSASYNGIGELSYYEDLAKNIDANLAEVDMESFRAEDIHSFLTHIPSLEKHNSHNDQNDIDSSICKSELLFSPVKESHISIDSLDLESYPEDGDIILTCKANKDNYTIAFEGSAFYSDESFYAEPADLNVRNKQNFSNLHNNLDDIVKQKSIEVSMSRSDHAFTTWSKLKKSSTSQLQRYPSGNNNTSVNITRHAPHCIVRKSSSLPNLRMKKENNRQLNVSQAVSNSTVESNKSRNLLPMCQMPVSTSGSESPAHNSNAHSTESSSKQQLNQPAFNLVKLFIKQKSGSSETCMDVSSGCWPSDTSSSLEQRVRKKSMNDSGKGSALSRHEEEEIDAVDTSFQLDSLDTCDQTNSINDRECNTTTNSTPRKMRNDLYREVFESQANRNFCKENNLNIRNNRLKDNYMQNLTVQNNNNNNSSDRESTTNTKSLSDTSRTSENLTQVFCNNNSHHNRIRIPVDTMTRSIQTSLMLKDRLRFVPPSFLAKLNKLGEKKSAPVYVIYPNYALPDLGFVKNTTPDVILSPFNYKNISSGRKRPTSLVSHEEEEALKKVDYKHIKDWKSLVTLLPIEYRKRLKHIPEADVELDPENSQRPLFCMTPPLRRTAKTNICDCATYFQTCTSSSGSSHPPSSGYRGSSTLLTESEFENIPTSGQTTGVTNQQQRDGGDVMKNMYVYQYENQRMDNEVFLERPPPSGRTPRSILRKNLRSATGRTKRNSMFENESSGSNINNFEKRRSLQEPYYMPEDRDVVEYYLTEMEDNRMRKQQQCYDRNHLNMLNQFDVNYMTEINLNVKKQQLQQQPYNNHHHYHHNHHHNQRKEEDDEMDARARAENFLSNVPKSELKYYAEIANILESADSNFVQYDAAKLKNEVSRALSQKKVSFNNQHHTTAGGGGMNMNYLNTGNSQKFSTPPNSPNISMAALRVNNTGNHNQRLRDDKRREEISAAEKEKQEKISSNRFKRLQIQWELLSKDSSVMLKDLAREKETQSGGSTPTSTGAQKSRIPRPVSYPATKTATTAAEARTIRSPSRIVPPKKYTVPPIPSTTAATQSPTARPRTPTSKLSNTPKKRVPSPKGTTRNR